jgi:hypothetical protein
LEDVTFEVLFDTSEETDLSVTKFYEANPEAKPKLGIVYDAFWCIRAEKGIERPVFRVPLVAEPTEGLWIADFHSAVGPTNQISGRAWGDEDVQSAVAPKNPGSFATFTAMRRASLKVSTFVMLLLL